MASIDQFVGSILGEYQIERMLGKSTLGAAYQALHSAGGPKAMVTIFNVPEALSAWEQEQLRLRFASEVEKLIQLGHPHILPIYAFGGLQESVYLVTAFAKEASLAQSLKKNTRFTPQQTLSLLTQLAAALDAAHRLGVVHGMLSLSNVMVSSDLSVQIAGFGLHAILESWRVTRNDRLFLGDPAYAAPECMLGQPAGAYSDVYALGIMLFELLSGTRPFSGGTPLESVQQRLQQPPPSIHAACPEVAEAFDLLLSNMLERDPGKRPHHVGEVAGAFERILQLLSSAQQATTSSHDLLSRNTQITLPPTVNWFADSTATADRGLTKSSGTDALPVASVTASGVHSVPAAARNPDSLVGVDPFVWWSAASANGELPLAAGTVSQRSQALRAVSRSHAETQQGRRKFVKRVVVGSAAVGMLAIGGVVFAQVSQHVGQSQLTDTTTLTSGASPTPGAQKTPNPSRSQTPQATATKSPKASPTKQSTTTQTQPTPAPTQPAAAPTPTPVPAHTGTVIGSTSQAMNSAIAFNNPADGRSSLLIRLASGNFVACERACTHAGVPVNYDASSHMLVCPAHDAVFDPQNSFAHTSGPGSGPLATVAIRVNGDGTITTG